MNLRTVFMGSPAFALPTLRALAQQYGVVGVITQPDKPAGRGNVLTPPPIKILAQELGLPLIQPRRLREPEAMAQLQTWAPDLIVVAAFGQILRPAVLDMPRYGCINVHASLLPRWRGAAPIQAAILAGDQESGVTIMKMDPGIDTGPVLSQRSIAIAPRDTAESLGEKLAELGAQALAETLPCYLSGECSPRPQEEFVASGAWNAEPLYAPMLRKEDGLLDPTQTAEALERRVRAMTPWPGAYLPWRSGLGGGLESGILKIHQAHVIACDSPDPGVAIVSERLPAIGTSHGVLALDVVQPPGKKPMPGRTFLQGARDWGKT